MRNINWKDLVRKLDRVEDACSRECRRETKTEAIRDGALGPVSWAFIDLLTDPDMEMLREMHISWR
jgi:hypothetical protein